MKAVVMEGKKKICVVLCEDGTFRKIRGVHKVGDTIEVKSSDFITAESCSTTLRKSLPILSGIAAAAVLTMGVGYYETSVACSYVTLDATPSIEYTLNRLDKVIKIEALNEEAQPIIETLTHQGVKYNSISDAIDMTVEVLRANDYLTDDTNEIIIDVVSESDSRSEKLSKQVEKSAAGSDSSLSLSLLKSDKEDRASAKGSGISTGQFKVIKDGRSTSAATTATTNTGTASSLGTVASSAANTARKQIAMSQTPYSYQDTTSDAANTPAYTPPSQTSEPSAPAVNPTKKKKKKASEASSTPADTAVASASITEEGNEVASAAATSAEASKENSGEASTTPTENTDAPSDGASNTEPAAPTEPTTPAENPTPEEPGNGDSGETPAPTPAPDPAPAPTPAPDPAPADPEPAPEEPAPSDEPTLPELPDPGPDSGEADTTPVPDQPGFSDSSSQDIST